MKKITLTLMYSGWEMENPPSQRDQDLQTELSLFVRNRAKGARTYEIPSGGDALHLKVEADSLAELTTLLKVPVYSPAEWELRLYKVQGTCDHTTAVSEPFYLLTQLFPAAEIALESQPPPYVSHGAKCG